MKIAFYLLVVIFSNNYGLRGVSIAYAVNLAFYFTAVSALVGNNLFFKK
jgi:hypothetical protein